LAFLAFYRDWRILITAAAVTGIDHLLRGLFFPISVYGVATASPLRTLEHVAWVVFINIFLIGACLRSTKEMKEIADQRAELESTKEIIEQKVVEQVKEIRLKDDETKAILETAEDAIFALKSDGLIISANRAAGELLGFEPSELTAKPLHYFISLADSSENTVSFADYSTRYFISPGDIRRELTATNCVGKTVEVEVSLGRLETENEHGYTAIVRNIAERKEVEKRVNEFYSTISHELRSPLTSIRGALALIAGGGFGDIPDEALELVNIANSSTKRLIRLINDILDLRKIEAGKMELEVSICEAKEIVETSVVGLQSMAAEAGVSVSFACESGVRLRADYDRLIQVVTNLVSNAIKFSASGQKVDVTVERQDADTLRFSVADNGPGIREEDLPKLFNKFQQLDSSDTRDSEGSGLGLAICKALVEQHHGRIGLDSKLGQGTTFWFDVPCIANSTQDRLAIVMKDSEKTVLIVEDDADLSIVLGAMLRMEGYKCLTAATVAEAENILSTVLPSAVICDLHLPDGNGMNFIDRLQDTPITSQLPVVIMTGSPEQQNHRRMVIDWLQKPFEDKQMLDAVKKAVGLKPAPTVLIVDDDPGTRTIVSRQLGTLGVNCLEARDGAQAISLIREKEPDLIILDVQMPRPDGYEVVEILRNQQTAPRMIVYSSGDFTEEQRKSLTLGLTRHVNKASRSETDLIEAVKDMLQKSVMEPATAEQAAPELAEAIA
jgi:PAS domain S-box-containing protein